MNVMKRPYSTAQNLKLLVGPVSFADGVSRHGSPSGPWQCAAGRDARRHGMEPSEASDLGRSRVTKAIDSVVEGVRVAYPGEEVKWADLQDLIYASFKMAKVAWKAEGSTSGSEARTKS